VLAVRATAVGPLSRERFEALMRRHPEAALTLNRMHATWIAARGHPGRNPVREELDDGYNGVPQREARGAAPRVRRRALVVTAHARWRRAPASGAGIRKGER